MIRKPQFRTLPSVVLMLFEIHVAVTLDDGLDEIRWRAYCRSHRYNCIRAVNAAGKDHVQHMIGKWCERPTEHEAIERANEIADEIRDNGFRVVRVKVEAMMMHPSRSTKTRPSDYWEFHMKVENTMTNINILRGFTSEKVALSATTNSLVVTIRLYDGTRDDAIEFKNKLVNDMKLSGIHIRDKIAAELAVFDTNPAQDDGWFVDLD